MKSESQLKIQAYLDNELSPGEARKVAQWISSEAESRELYQALKETKEILAQNEPELKLGESRDFYWSKIRRDIQSSERIAEIPAQPWWKRLVAPLAGAVALFAVLISVMDRGGSTLTLSQGSAPAATPMHELQQTSDVSTITFRSEAEGVTVVWLTSAQ